MNYEAHYKDKDQKYFKHSRSEIFPFIPLGIKKALDVGCGEGDFGALLKSRLQCEVWGIEPNIKAANLASTKLDHIICDLFGSDITELKYQKFDAIFFNDVLEHLADPSQALNICKNILNVEGYIIASIPNIRWYPVLLSLLRYKDFEYQDSGVMDKTHLRFFTYKSMIRLFENSGYRVQSINGINGNENFKYFNILNFLLFKREWDMKFPQFVIVAKIDGKN